MSKVVVEELYRKWYKPVRAWVRQQGNVPKLWVEDITQEIFIRFLQYDPQIEVNATGYLFRVASNTVSDWTQRAFIHRKHVGTDDVDEWTYGLIDPPETALEDQQLSLQIEMAMSQLKSRQLLVLMSHMYDNKTYKEIAKDFGLTSRTVLRDLTTSYNRLRSILLNVAEDSQLLMRRISDERANNNDRRLQTATSKRSAKLRHPTPHVGLNGGVHRAGAPSGGFPGGAVEQRSDENRRKGGQHEPSASA